MRKFIPATRRLVTSDLFRNFAGGFAIGAVGLFGFAAKAQAATIALF